MHAQTEKETLQPNRKKVLTKAIHRLQNELGLSRQELSFILGPSEATFSRLFNHSSENPKYLDPSSKEGELAILLLKLYKNLDLLLGGNKNQCQLWLRSENKH